MSKHFHCESLFLWAVTNNSLRWRCFVFDVRDLSGYLVLLCGPWRTNTFSLATSRKIIHSFSCLLHLEFLKSSRHQTNNLYIKSAEHVIRSLSLSEWMSAVRILADLSLPTAGLQHCSGQWLLVTFIEIKPSLTPRWPKLDQLNLLQAVGIA